MSRKVFKKPQAYRDVMELADYLARDSLAAAIRIADAFDITCESLRTQPSLGMPWESDNTKCQDLHYWPIEGFPKYLLFFRPVAGGIEVLRVLHAARDFDRISFD